MCLLCWMCVDQNAWDHGIRHHWKHPPTSLGLISIYQLVESVGVSQCITHIFMKCDLGVQQPRIPNADTALQLQQLSGVSTVL